MDNFLDAEALLIAHLTAALGEKVRFVGSMADMQTIEEQSQRTPAVYVVYDGYTPGQTTTESRVAEIKQRWLVIVAVRNVSGVHTGAAAREDAGEVLAHLFPALQAYRPSAGHSRLTLVPPPPAVYRAGFAYIPTAWETNIVSHHNRSNTT